MERWVCFSAGIPVFCLSKQLLNGSLGENGSSGQEVDPLPWSWTTEEGLLFSASSTDNCLLAFPGLKGEKAWTYRFLPGLSCGEARGHQLRLSALQLSGRSWSWWAALGPAACCQQLLSCPASPAPSPLLRITHTQSSSCQQRCRLERDSLFPFFFLIFYTYFLIIFFCVCVCAYGCFTPWDWNCEPPPFGYWELSLSPLSH